MGNRQTVTINDLLDQYPEIWDPHRAPSRLLVVSAAMIKKIIRIEESHPKRLHGIFYVTDLGFALPTIASALEIRKKRSADRADVRIVTTGIPADSGNAIQMVRVSSPASRRRGGGGWHLRPASFC